LIDFADTIDVTGDVIARSLKEMLKSLGCIPEDVLLWVADAGSNGISAVEEFLSGTWWHCISHRLQLSVKVEFPKITFR
jgi:hypothetical protein